MSAMLTFSSCHGGASRSCAFSNYRKPKQFHDESFLYVSFCISTKSADFSSNIHDIKFIKIDVAIYKYLSLTALSTSLLCEASTDERIICPLLSYLLNEMAADMDIQFTVDSFLDRMDFVSYSQFTFLSSFFVKSIFKRLNQGINLYSLFNFHLFVKIKLMFLL